MDGKSTQGKYIIRDIEVSEIAEVMDLFDLFNEETKTKHYKREDFQDVVEDYLVSPTRVCLGMYSEDTLSGFIIGKVQTHPFKRSEVISLELAWFVSKLHRGSLTSIRLVKEFERRSKELGATTCIMAVRSNLKDASIVYERLGYHEEERTYVRSL